MKLITLVVIVALGVVIPLFWITGTLTSIIYYIWNLPKKVFTLNPQLGITMADGGEKL